MHPRQRPEPSPDNDKIVWGVVIGVLGFVIIGSLIGLGAYVLERLP